MMQFRKYATGGVLMLMLATMFYSCTTDLSYYQKQVSIPDAHWHSKFQPLFQIEITDSGKQYTPYLLIRHDESYPYSNIWLNVQVRAPGDSVFGPLQRIEFELADAEGKWEAVAVGGVWEHLVPFTVAPNDVFRNPGMYEVKLEQVMRKDPLPAVLNVGIRLQPKK
jgi:gliding motility-associated lipoprotein GldH